MPNFTCSCCKRNVPAFENTYVNTHKGGDVYPTAQISGNPISARTGSAQGLKFFPASPTGQKDGLAHST